MPAPLPLAPDYAAARADLLARVDAATGPVRHTARLHPLTGPDGGPLALDVVWLGPDDATDVVVVVSGTHGVEGHAGSALQRTWLRDLDPARPDGVAVCLVHALNPWGMAWTRRVNEDNVDLNRNFVDFEDLPANPGYDRVADLLVPERWDDDTRQRTTEALLEVVGEVGLDTFQQWVSGGQYHHPDGIFHGGVAPVWSHVALHELATGPLRGRQRVAIVDLHTGLGPWGVGELISSEAPESAGYQRSVAWWGDDVTSLVAGDSVSAELSGEWLPAVGAALDPAEVTAVALEFGTVDSVTVLQALRADAWLHAHGDPSGPEAAPVKADLRAAFADPDPAWIATLDERFRTVLGGAFAGLA